MGSNTDPTRRTVLGTVGTGALVLVSGCGMLGRGTVTAQYMIEPVDGGGSLSDSEVDINGGSHAVDEFELEETTEIRYTVGVLSGPSIDAFLVDADNLDAIEAGEGFTAIDGSITLDAEVANVDGVELEAGSYALVIDNGDVEPENA